MHKKLPAPQPKPLWGWGVWLRKFRAEKCSVHLGLFASKEAAAKTMKAIPRIKVDPLKVVVAGPLKDFPMEPDIVVVESVPEHIMWIGLAANFKKGGRLDFNSSIFQAECVDVTTVPYLTGKINMTLGCYGC